MTDTHSPIPEEHDPESTQDHGIAPAEHDVWQGDQPPVDDFSDPATAETATVSEEMESPAENVVADSKKRSVVLPIAVAVGGLVFLGAILYWQFGGMAHTASPSTLMAEQSTPPLPPPPTPQMPDSSSTANVAPTQGMAPPSEAPAAIMASNTQAGAAVPAPAPPLPPPPAMANAPLPSMPSLPSATGAVPPPPSSMGTMPSSSFPTAPSQLSPPPPPPPAPSAAGIPDERLRALSMRVEDLQKSLNQTLDQLSLINTKLAASNTPSANPIMEDRLNKIEQQVLQIQHAAPLASEQETPPQIATAYLGTKTPPLSHRTHHTVSSHKAAHRATKAKSKTHTPSTPVHWVLRAATPDEAWVAKDGTTRELRAVHVGEDLPGIGRVSAIRQDGESWVIDGATGSVH